MNKIFFPVITLYVIQLITALICGPYSCKWGNASYFGFGLFGLIGIVIYMLLQRNWDLIKRLGYAALFSFFSLLVWVTGFLLGDFSILCRLF
ncbi:MAG: hypothetical protein H7122_12235 [Chitinophagaceae bacterium]|nr:hypothetical protein [Chitinophagaceae bacterium]